MQNEELTQPDYIAPPADELDNLPAETEPPSPNNPPWNILVALGVWVMSIIFMVVFQNILLAPYLASQNVQFSDQRALLDFVMNNPTAIILQLAAVVPAHVFTIILAWIVVTNFKKYSFREMLGWNWGGFKVWHAVVITFFFYGLMILLNSVLGDVENDFEKMLTSSRTAVYLVAFFATFTAPLVEEVVYRGILFSALQNPKKIIFGQVGFLRKFQEFYALHSTFFAVLIVTLLFAVIHIPQYSKDATPDYTNVVALVILSLTLTMIRVRTKNLLPCFVLHTVFNGLQALLMISLPFLERYIENSKPKPEVIPGVIISLFI